ncbi:hypothetical protein QI060_12900 [Staphylococcus saprophyticus]|uniref:hypothetical protein n=1 Tax=Staphylococcus saprophyticus TaxID=29385 RepID=UPI000F45D313|nr:hypothetical protein [Staphylococcus saprophyticus]RNM25111.1 hypothetical protein EFY80_10735 [Staphylococcus cohnii]MDW3973611.1 hypothetical protein [Staphylococcus saprophyticus]MDW4033813.1 hypothetical protein [Staphylococcus saprophyticus]MDW4103147.1 hypothetical protein [Staphylococcus saprophyticus]MDW4303140.1 hypothetical protein [Staphylococcus saprophyticus]
MKNILFLVSCFVGIFYFYKYKEMKELYELDLIDIESSEDLLERKGIYVDSEGNFQKTEVSKEMTLENP